LSENSVDKDLYKGDVAGLSVISKTQSALRACRPSALLYGVL